MWAELAYTAGVPIVFGLLLVVRSAVSNTGKDKSQNRPTWMGNGSVFGGVLVASGIILGLLIFARGSGVPLEGKGPRQPGPKVTLLSAPDLAGEYQPGEYRNTYFGFL